MADNDWAQPAPEMVAKAKEQTLSALRSPEAASKLRRFYDTTTDYAGASFVTIGANVSDRIAADDLFATTLLSVKIPARAARLLTQDGATAKAIRPALRGLPAASLAHVDSMGLTRMEVFYRLVKENLAKAGAKRSNAWVVASKLCARKRPDLFPVRDNVVCRLLDVQRANDYRVDWLVYQALISDREVLEAIETVRAEVVGLADANVLLDREPLRLLDAALWTSAKMA